MNLQQLQYIVAVDEYRHFQRAAEACFITPATLSMMVKKLEQELDLTLFDRSKHPIVPTDIGAAVINKAKTILYHIKDLENVAKESHTDISGEVRIAVIPTLAPYLCHLFLPGMMTKYPQVRIKLFEWNTDQIIQGLIHNRTDIGIAATPLHHKEIKELPLFYEKLIAYTAEKIDKKADRYITPKDIDLNRLWLLEEEHCLRAQVMNLCSLRKRHGENGHLDFEAGSIETLMNIVDINEGITIIPELVAHTLTDERKMKVKQFAHPVPVREISLLTYRYFVKEKLLTVLANEVISATATLLSASEDSRQIISVAD